MHHRSASKIGQINITCGLNYNVEYFNYKKQMLEKGQSPCQIHNNCSGKHAGMLCLAKYLTGKTKGYINYDILFSNVDTFYFTDLCLNINYKFFNLFRS